MGGDIDSYRYIFIAHSGKVTLYGKEQSSVLYRGDIKHTGKQGIPDQVKGRPWDHIRSAPEVTTLEYIHLLKSIKPIYQLNVIPGYASVQINWHRISL